MLAGQRAVITGASKGIGQALAIRLSQLGCAITLVSRTEQLLSDTLEQLSLGQDQVHDYVVYDLAKLMRDSGTSKVEELNKTLAESSILVNCAGVANHSLLHKLQSETIANTLQVNLLSPILLSKMALMPMLKHLRKLKIMPQILNISSMLSLSGVTIGGTTPYAALKAGLLGFTQSLLGEMNGKLRVNAVLPGLVPETDMGKTGSKSLPSVSLKEVIDTCEKVITDQELNGALIVADGKGFRKLEQVY